MRTIVVRRQYIIGLGAAILIAGLVFAAWAFMRPRDPNWNSLAITAGPIRPPLIVLPLESGPLAVAEETIRQGQMVRAMRTIPLTAFSQTAGASPCPTVFDASAPAACLSATEIAAYANALTLSENRQRRVDLSTCYTIGTRIDLNARCSGFRLPTMREMRDLRVFQEGSRGQTAETAAPILGDAELVQRDDSDTLSPGRVAAGRWIAMGERSATTPFRLVRGAAREMD